MIASEEAAMNAQLKPCTRARRHQHLLALGGAAHQRGRGEEHQRRDEHSPLPKLIGGTPAQQEEPREGDRVRVDDPQQLCRGEVEARLDRGQRHIDDAQVEDDHELRHAADGKNPAFARTNPGVCARQPPPLGGRRDVGVHAVAGADRVGLDAAQRGLAVERAL